MIIKYTSRKKKRLVLRYTKIFQINENYYYLLFILITIFMKIIIIFY